MADDLFLAAAEARRRTTAPLADRMRPRTLDQYVGQGHILAPGKLLRRAVEADRVTSLILFGPPGSGKTTLARIIANTTRKHFASLNAVLAGVKDIREQIAAAQERQALHGQGTILFVDEVHRFNKAQQDALLPHVENGTVTFVGATTENPYFEVNKALVSRSRVFELRTLTEADLRAVVEQTLADEARGYGRLDVRLDADARDHLVDTANGDARSLLNALELAVETTEAGAEGIHVTLAVAEDSIQKRAVLYDKDGDAHYDTVSAFIKSMRGSDPDAALYWMARMIYAGEDPRFVLRRMLIFACEDVGMADPNAVREAVACAQAFDYVGMPEGRFMLGQLCVYLATAPKSNSNFAFFSALAHVEAELSGDVPNPLKDAKRDKQGLGHGKGYKYPHAYQDHYVPEQYLPSGMQGTYFYEPSDQGYEARIAARLGALRARDEAESIEKRVQRYAEDE
ncbi:MAG: AAA family ATPase [Bacteroidota bacterium]